jgi:hypothetical protein
MSDSKASAIDAARLRVREAQEKSDRHQRRYALRATTGQRTTKSEEAQAERALVMELEAALDASKDALRKLEAVA